MRESQSLHPNNKHPKKIYTANKSGVKIVNCILMDVVLFILLQIGSVWKLSVLEGKQFCVLLCVICRFKEFVENSANIKCWLFIVGFFIRSHRQFCEKAWQKLGYVLLINVTFISSMEVIYDLNVCRSFLMLLFLSKSIVIW